MPRHAVPPPRAQLAFRSRVFRRLNEETLRTGRLCKSVSVADLHGTSLSQVRQRRWV